MGINIVAGYMAPKQKKMCHSHHKTLPSDEEEEYNSFSKDSWGDDDPGPLSRPVLHRSDLYEGSGGQGLA